MRESASAHINILIHFVLKILCGSHPSSFASLSPLFDSLIILKMIIISNGSHPFKMIIAGDEGIEPPTAVLETAIMPLN